MFEPTMTAAARETAVARWQKAIQVVEAYSAPSFHALPAIYNSAIPNSNPYSDANAYQRRV